MAGQAKVDDLEVFRQFRAALLKFAHASSEVMGNADSQISRTQSWLENEQTTFWQAQIRKRTEAVAQAKDAVRQKKLYKDSSGRIPNAIEEEKNLARCQAALLHAQQKYELVRKWIPKLEKENELYRGGIARLNATVTGDIPRALGLLDRLAGALEEYLQIESAGLGGGAGTSTDPAVASMAREGDSVPETVTEEQIPPAPETPENKNSRNSETLSVEGRDGSNGV